MSLKSTLHTIKIIPHPTAKNPQRFISYFRLHSLDRLGTVCPSHRLWGQAMRLSGLSLLLLVAGIVSPLAWAEPAYEREQLHLMLGQLDRLEALARRSQQSLPLEAGSRYRFDYARLQQDIEQVRSGISAYLSPERQQPRMPVDFPELSGHYRLDCRTTHGCAVIERTTP